MADSPYEVVWPLGKSVSEPAPLADRSQSLAGKTVCEVWDRIFRGDEIFAILHEELPKKFPGIKFVDYTKFGDTAGPSQREVVADLPNKLKQYGCDAVISGVGA
ncbi:MAG: hypothetical protein HYX92_06690 [Chloroflexi bacterium]|nr:hypothetical protein [Chloroflexota bacterium]